MPAARRRTRQPRRKLKQRVPSRAVRYMRSVRPADGAELRYRVLMRKVVAEWWAKIGPQALSKAKQIAKPETERSDAEESDEADVSLHDYSGEADAGWFGGTVEKVGQDVSRHGKNEIDRIGVKLSKTASIRVEPAIAKQLPVWRRENVALIKTLFGREKTTLEGLLADGAGRRYETLARDIEARFGIATRHAELIARDQTNKLNSRISQQRMVAAGITSYRWTTAGDERVRPMHDDLDGEEFEFDDPPVTNDNGDTNNPGEDYQCRCVPFPILPELGDEEDEAEQALDDAQTPEEEPVTPEPEPAPEPEAEPLAAKAEQFAFAISTAPAKARGILREQISKTMPGATSKDATLGRAGAHVFTTSEQVVAMGADAYHDWTGDVVLAPKIRDNLERGAKMLARGGFSEAFRDSKLGDELERKAIRAADGLRVAVHEEIHGYSRTTMQSYFGVGRIVEEVGTELSARDVVMGLDPNIAGNKWVQRGVGFGAYHQDIKGVTEIIARHAGVDTKAAEALIRKAHSERVCAPKAPFTSALEHLGEFVAGLDLPAEPSKLIHDDLIRLAEPTTNARLPAR